MVQINRKGKGARGRQERRLSDDFLQKGMREVKGRGGGGGKKRLVLEGRRSSKPPRNL